MPAIDERLTIDLERAARPADPRGVLEHVEERRVRRATRRRVGRAGLAVVVFAVTAAGFVALRSAFEMRSNIGDLSPLPGNGLIVFERRGADDRSHLYTMRPDGTDVRKLTDFATNDGQPAVSPDGRTVAFVHELEDRGPVIGSIPIEGDVVSWLTGEDLFVVGGPSWSPDGARVAFPAHDRGGQRLYLMNANGTEQRALTGDDVHWVDSAAWSPDGSLIAFTASPLSGDDDPSVWDVYTIRPDGTGLTNVTNTPEVDEGAPTWAPDGARIAFSIASGRGSSIVALRLGDGSSATLTDGDDIDTSPAWSPDGTLIAFERAPASGGDFDVWTMRPDGGEPTRLTAGGGLSPSWQPIPAGAEPTPEPTPSPTPEPEGKDIGLGFNLCHTEHLGGIDFLGDGTRGTAWTGTKVKPNGTCPTNYDDRFGVAVDYTGDGVADSWSGETITYCGGCEPLKAMDLNTDGREELLVVLDYFSIMHYGVYTVLAGGGEPQVVSFRVGEPGHPEHSLDAGKPFTFWVGGDAGLSDWFYCESLPTIWLTSTESPIDAKPGDVKTVHETEVSLGTDGVAHILHANTYTVSAEATLSLTHTTPDFSDPDCGIGVGPG